jgi:type II secretion system protein G
MKRAPGFTLIEVMVVVVILGLLAAIIVPKVMSRPDEARAVAAKADIAAITQALKLYRLDNTAYPSTEQGLQALVARPSTQPIPVNWKQGGYLDRLPGAIVPSLTADGAAQIVAARSRQPFASREAFVRALPTPPTASIDTQVDVRSRYFSAAAMVRLGRVVAGYRALFERDDRGKPGLLTMSQMAL